MTRIIDQQSLAHDIGSQLHPPATAPSPCPLPVNHPHPSAPHSLPSTGSLRTTEQWPRPRATQALSKPVSCPSGLLRRRGRPTHLGLRSRRLLHRMASRPRFGGYHPASPSRSSSRSSATRGSRATGRSAGSHSIPGIFPRGALTTNLSRITAADRAVLMQRIQRFHARLCFSSSKGRRPRRTRSDCPKRYLGGR